MVKSSDKSWPTGEGNGKPLRYSCLENPMNSMKRQKDRTLKEELPRSIGAQYATGDQWRNNSRKNEETEPKHSWRKLNYSYLSFLHIFGLSSTNTIISEAKLQAIIADLHLSTEMPPNNKETKALAIMEEPCFFSSKGTHD